MFIDAALTPPDIDELRSRDLSGTVCVAFDVLRATSCMITGFAHGMDGAIPVSTIKEALAEKATRPDAMLGGERYGERIEGFDIGNSPFEYRALAGRTVITTTTNGTLALKACVNAAHTFAAALLNLDATAEAVRRLQPERVLLLCAGTFRKAALEDIFAAGALAAKLEGKYSDEAYTTLSVWNQYQHDALHLLQISQNGRVLTQNGRAEEIVWCAQTSIYDLVASMKNGVVTLSA